MFTPQCGRLLKKAREEVGAEWENCREKQIAVDKETSVVIFSRGQ